MKKGILFFLCFCLPISTVFAETASQTPLEALQAGYQSFNPDISVIIDTFYHGDNSHDGLNHLFEEMTGFGHAHDHDDHGHHHGVDEGFNLRHLEIMFSAAVDPWFRATAIAAVDIHGAEIEEAHIETTGLPMGLRVKAGKFFSDFGYINAVHAHEWDFVDQPLVFQLLTGDHGINDLGVQVSWLPSLPVYCLFGVELFQGNNEILFDYHGHGYLPEKSGPRAVIGWVKFAPNLPGFHGLLLGGAYGTGTHQEQHGPSGDYNHWLDGDTSFWSVNAVYKYNAPKPYGQGNLTIQGEYFRRKKDITLVRHYNRPELEGNPRIEEQDGYYIQFVYGFKPRWRAGLRWEQVGLTNSITRPTGVKSDYDSSYRLGAMVDFTPSEFSRLRLQANLGQYETDHGSEDVFELKMQWMISMGAHGAHTF